MTERETPRAAEFTGDQQASLGLFLAEHDDSFAAFFDTARRTVACTPAMRRVAAIGADPAPDELFASLPQPWRAALLAAFAGTTTLVERLAIQGRIVTATVRPLCGAAGEIIGASLLCKDETALSTLEAQAALFEETLRVAMRTSLSGAWRLDLKSNSVWISPEYEEIMGVRLGFEDLTSRTPWWLYAEDVPQYQAFLRELSGPSGRGSIEHRLADAPDTWIHAICERVEENGERAFVGMARNVTARKRAEIELMDATRRAQRTLSAKRAMLNDILKDLGLSTAEPDPASDETSAYATGVAELTRQFLSITSDLEARDAVLGEAVQQLRLSRQRAHSANAAKTRFLAAMTHELRTPLNAIIGFSEILLEDAAAKGDPGAEADQERVLVAARKLLHMVESILDLAEIDGSDRLLVLEEFDPRAVIDEAGKLVHDLVESNGNTFSVSAGDLGLAFGDRRRLKQCLVHLLSNACKFTQQGEIALQAGRVRDETGEQFVFSVMDTGPGIDAAKLARLFEPFALSDPTRAQGGAGIGLALTREMARLMGGDVTVISAPGRGSTFTLRIAARQPSPSHAAA